MRGVAGPHTVWRMLGLAFLLAGLSAGILLVVSRTQKASLPETPWNQLALRNGRWYRVGEANPFTGVMVETYDSGLPKARSEIANGLLDGLSEGWHTNGQKQVREHFRAGTSHGIRTKWHTNGRKLSEVSVVDGKLEGIFRRWNEDGTLAQEIQLARGEPEGVSRAYYASGYLSAEARLHQGQVLDQRFWKDGEHKPPQIKERNGRNATVPIPAAR